MRIGSEPRSFFEVEHLDPRLLLSAVNAPTVTMLGASTLDSQSLTVSYDVSATGTDTPLTFGVYRSSTPQFSTDAVPVGSTLTAPNLDASGISASIPGDHQVVLTLPDGLPIDPEHPYVLVVADPDSASSPDPASVASFRVESIAIVTHGGLEYGESKTEGPTWEQQMAKSLRGQGYDEVIAYNWVAQSSTPGEAIKQVPKLTAMILEAASKFPSGDPVDLQFIGHSEGAVINTQTIVKIEAATTYDPSIKAGYLDDTLLDPHAANPDFPGTQYSVNGPLGWIAKLAIDNYQARARDPLVFIPKQVDAAQVYYQQTPADRAHGQNLNIYNLWGQVPVKGNATYFNLTAAGAVHSGSHSVYAWYENHIVPTLGDGASEVARDTLVGNLSNSTKPGGSTITSHRATYAGASAPGSTVYLMAAKAGPGPLEFVGKAVTADDGTWVAKTRPLSGGRYRVVAEAHGPDWNPKEATDVPTDPLGLLVVDR